MNYFRCTVGGSGKGNTVTVTCDEEFAGLTITLSKTGKTYTKTCPSTAPYVVTFYGVENGTYTVSGTVDGETYSETVVVQDISCVLNFGFKWQIWVDTASQLDSSDYDTLDEVLADEKALRELFLEHACVDYMASLGASNDDLETVINNDLCAKWINLSDYALDYLYANEVIADLMDEADKYGYGEWALMPQVPTMTSDTAPIGEASAESINGTGYPAWKAFDNDMSSSSMWASGVNHPTNTWVQYKFINQVRVTKILIVNRWDTYNTQNVKDFKVQGSNDGTNFTDIYTGECLQSTSFEEQTFEFSNDDAYSYYRLLITSNYGSTECSSVCSLQFYAWVPKGNIPIMTANNAPYGTASAYRAGSNREAYRGFDENFAALESYTSGQSMNTSDYLQYRFANPICAKRFYILPVSATDLVNYSIKASNDGATWTTLYSGTNESVNPITQNINNDNYYSFYRITCDSTSGTYWFSIAKLQFYGRELKVSVPTMTSNTAPYGEAFGGGGTGTSDGQPWNMFDGNDGTHYGVGDNGEWYVGYKFNSPMVLKAMYYKTRNTVHTQTVSILGSNDGVSYTLIDTYSHAANVTNMIQISNSENYKYYKLVGTDAYYSGFYTLQFYGLDYSEKEFANDGRKWLFDHGVELEEITLRQGTGITNGIAKIEANRIYLSTGSSNDANASNFSAAVFKTAINLAQYNLFRANGVGDEFAAADADSNNRMEISSGNTRYDGSSYNDTGVLATLKIPSITNLPNNLCIDCSSINQDAYVDVVVRWTASKKCTFAELWLEP